MEPHQKNQGGAQTLLEPYQEVQWNESDTDWVEQSGEDEEESDKSAIESIT